MAEDIVVIGAGGFGRETLDVIEAINAASDMPIWNVIGVVDDSPANVQLERIAQRKYEYIGTCARVTKSVLPARFAIGIGSPETRSRLAEIFEVAGWIPATLIHPTATVGSEAMIGSGSTICSGVQLSTNTDLGRYVHLNPGVIIGHDTVLGEFVSVNPGAIVSGEVDIRARTLVGAGAVILQGLTVGNGAIVGASACVTKDVDANVTSIGVPSRQYFKVSGP